MVESATSLASQKKWRCKCTSPDGVVGAQGRGGASRGEGHTRMSVSERVARENGVRGRDAHVDGVGKRQNEVPAKKDGVAQKIIIICGNRLQENWVEMPHVSCFFLPNPDVMVGFIRAILSLLRLFCNVCNGL